VKGAPGRTLERCTRALAAGGERPLDAEERRALRAENEAMGARGLRVLALAWKEGAEAAGPETLTDLVFLGFAGMMDPPAEGVTETIRTLRDAGIRTVMITGDQRATAEAVGRELGIVAGGEQVFDGAALGALEGEEWLECVRQAGAFSRVSPEDKLRLVDGYRQAGEIVAMLGDGVNDAAALRRADVGVAMGIRGTDVAKEAAAVVLQDDRFATVAAAVEEGRVVYANIRRFVFFLFSCNVAEVLVLLLCGLAGLPAPLGPLPILWMNLVTDTFPALALAMEPADADVMRRPPHDPRAALLSRGFLVKIGLYGLLITACSLGAYLVALRTVPLEHARTARRRVPAAAALHPPRRRPRPARLAGDRPLLARPGHRGTGDEDDARPRRGGRGGMIIAGKRDRSRPVRMRLAALARALIPPGLPSPDKGRRGSTPPGERLRSRNPRRVGRELALA